MTRPTKHPKSGVYRIRRVVPPHLRGVNGLGRERIITLGTKDPREAAKKAPAALAAIAREFARAEAAVQPARRVPIKEQVALCGIWYRDWTGFHEDDPGSAKDWETTRDVLLGDVQDADEGAAHAWRKLTTEARAFLAEQGVAADDASLREFALRFRLTHVRAAETLRKRSLGDYSADPHLASFPDMPAPAAKEVPPLTAEAALAMWAAERNPAAATLRAYAGKFRRIAEVLGFDDLRRITAADVVRFKQARLEAGKDAGTVQDDIVTGSTICRWAVDNGHLPANPFERKAPRPLTRGEKPRHPFTDEEAKCILAAARAERGWLRWSPWILAFTGARVSEIAELRRRHIREEAGVMCFDIHPIETREGKNQTFMRLIPLHPAIMAEGFMDYVKSLPDNPDGPLFPDLKPDPRGSRVDAGTTKAGRWLRKVVGIKDPKKAPNHSWRHRIEDDLRRVRALPELVDAITGRHNPRNAGAGYGNGFRGMPDEVLKDLAKVPSPMTPQQQDPGG